MIKSNTNPIFDFSLLNTEHCVNEIINLFKEKQEEYNKIKHNPDNLLEFFKDSIVIDLYCTVNKNGNGDSTNTKVYFNQEFIFSLYTNKYFYDYVIKNSITLEVVSEKIRCDVNRKIKKEIAKIQLIMFETKNSNYIDILKKYPTIVSITDPYILIRSTYPILFEIDCNPFLDSLTKEEEILRKEILYYYEFNQLYKTVYQEYSEKRYSFSKEFFEYIDRNNRWKNLYLINSKIGCTCLFFAIKYKLISQDFLEDALNLRPIFCRFFNETKLTYKEFTNLLSLGGFNFSLTREYEVGDNLPLDFPKEFLKFVVRVDEVSYKDEKQELLDIIIEHIFSGIVVKTVNRFYYITKNKLIQDILRNPDKYLEKYQVTITELKNNLDKFIQLQ